MDEKYELTGTKKQIVKELSSLNDKGFLGIGENKEKGLSNAELSDRIDKSKGAITNATQDLMRKDIIYNAERPTSGRTDFRVKDDINIRKTYKTNSILSASIILHGLELALIGAIVLSNTSKYIFHKFGFAFSIVFSGLVIISPRFAYNFYKAVQVELDYNMVVETGV